MKLWELVPCWGQPSGAAPQPPSSPSPPEETQVLMQRTAANQPAGRRKRSSAAWRPSLGAIGEDHAAALITSPAARSRRVADSGGQKGGAARRSRPARPAPSPRHEKERHG